jgi:FAD:protein FMN transferase
VTTTHRRVEQVMGLPVSLALRGRHTDDRRAHEAWQEAVAVLHDVDRIFSTYRPDSFISRLGRGELTELDCPPEVTEVLTLGEAARVASNGAFDVRRIGPDGLQILDTNGVVKGWAVERAARAFDDLDETDLCLSAGGDMVCRVRDPEGSPWQIGIEDPHDAERIKAVIPVSNGAVATSGTAHRGPHIVHAATNAGPAGIASVTVVSDNLTWADIDATAAFAMGSDAVRWLRTRAGRVGLVVWEDGTAETFGTQPG